jgi:hypothetical protein
MSAPTGLRRTQSRMLVSPSARTIRWGSLPVLAGLAALVVWTEARKDGNPAVVALPVATTLLCMWLCFLFDDPAAEMTAGRPTPLLFRRAIRVAIAVPAVAAAWFACTWIGPLSGPTGPMAASFAAEVVIALAAAAVVVRGSGNAGGLLAAAVVVFAALILPVAVGRPPSVDPAYPPFGQPLSYWPAVGALALAFLAIAHIDPAGSGARTRRR